MEGQVELFDYMPTIRTEPELGEIVEHPGQVICHIMKPAYIGQKVVMHGRVVIYHGEDETIRECLPWECYPERMKNIGKRREEG